MDSIHLIIAPKISRRAMFWKEVLEQNNLRYLHVSYVDIMQDNFTLDSEIKYVVRLESAGEDFETYKAIVSFSNAKEKPTLIEEDFGLISNFKNWYIGWGKLLIKIKNIENDFHLNFINNPEDIALTFDKKLTQNLLIANSINCPEVLNSSNYDELLAEMKSKKIHQVFIKPSAGSSASGIIALRSNGAEKQIAYSTIKKNNNKYYNSLKIQVYNKPNEIKELFNEMNTYPLQIERWIPKWQFNKMNVDFRVVVINKKVEFIVPRGSRQAITNLHLGNQKLKKEDLNLSEEIIKKIEQAAIKTMTCFPGLHYAGIDILLSKKGKVYVLEVNSFGDMLLKIVNKKLKTTYEQELESLQFLE